MNNLVIILLNKKLLTSSFLTISPVHRAEFEELAALTGSYFANRYILKFRLIFLMGTITATLF